MSLPYNPENKESIIQYAKTLRGKTLRQICDVDLIKNNRKGKGHFGQILEEFFFQYKPNSGSDPDFPIAKLELKSSPLKALKPSKFQSKERLVLNIINYLEIVNQDFENSTFWKKNAHILLVFYLRVQDTDILDYLIKLVDDWSFPKADLEIIKQDWEFIKQKIANGKAHELSEGDTFYLGACTKGATSNTTRKQPFNEIPAKQRAFSLKQGYVNHIIASISNGNDGIYGKLIPDLAVLKAKSLEEIVLEKFAPYYDKTADQIIDELGINLNKNAKHFLANLTKSILGVALNKEIEEFKKADITLKTVRVNKKGSIKECISFSSFKYTELVTEIWEDANFKNTIESKFLFAFFKIQDKNYVFQKVKFWNMPHDDVPEAKKVWEHTRNIVNSGTIVKKIMPDGTRATNFMGKTQNRVSHVRPHAQNSADTILLPVADQLTKATEYTKYCFWLNNTYIRDEIYLK
ncbi:MAG: DNA mismatch repair protein [Bacteroidetes bacterium]|nr:DNA mismatch repair protein [Bacteroidota bacterium]